MIKKSLMILFCIIFLSSLVVAQSLKIEFPDGDKISMNGDIKIKVTIYDSSNNAIDGDISVSIKDPMKIEKLTQIIKSKDIAIIDLGENTIAGEWKITAKYNDIESTESFLIESTEKLSFDIKEDVLTITNTGNTKYTREIQIIIGETPGTKRLDLDVGEKISFTLVAPDGNYNIKVTNDKGESIFTVSNVPLKGRGVTGDVIGILDENAGKRSPFTGGISPSENSNEAILSYLKNSKFVYVFILVIFGAMILLAIERNYRRKVK